MKNSTNETSIIKDLAIFDYVAGQQSKDVRDNFEKTLEQDPDLMREVLAEQQLRRNLEESASGVDSRPVSMENFDALLERIELDERQTDEQQIVNDASNSTSADNVIVVQSWRWQKPFNIAASFVFIAMIGFVGFNQTTEPNFTTLSNKAASADVDFASLVEQQRMIKLEFSDDLASSEIIKVLESYQLSSIESGAVGQTALVSSQHAVNITQLADLLKDERIVVAELVSFDAE